MFAMERLDAFFYRVKCKIHLHVVVARRTRDLLLLSRRGRPLLATQAQDGPQEHRADHDGPDRRAS